MRFLRNQREPALERIGVNEIRELDYERLTSSELVDNDLIYSAALDWAPHDLYLRDATVREHDLHQVVYGVLGHEADYDERPRQSRPAEYGMARR